MNEIELSNDLTNIEDEILFFTQRTQRSLWELGRRFKHVKENDLAHGSFMDWYENLGFGKNFVSDAIKIAEEFPNFPTLGNFKSDTALRLASHLPKELREKEHTLESGETKTVDEMTTRELREVKKKNKQQEETIKEQERKLKQAKRSEEIAIEKLEKEQNKEPEVVTETKEVVPDDYKDLEESERKLRVKAKRSDEEIGRLKEKIQRMEKLEADKEEVERVKSEIKQLDAHKEKANRTLEAHRKLKELEKEFNEFFDSKMAPLKYKPLVNDLQGFNGTDRIKKLVNLARAWVEDMDQMLPAENRKIIEGEIVNE